MAETGNMTSDANISALFDFGFKRFITLGVIKFLYVLGVLLMVIASVVSWLTVVAGGFRQGALTGLITMVVATMVIALALAIYVIIFRVWLELIVVIFRIGENSSKLVALQGGTAADAANHGRLNKK